MTDTDPTISATERAHSIEIETDSLASGLSEISMDDHNSSSSATKDDNYLDLLTPEEREALEKFKQNPITHGHSDRWLMPFVFARKLNVERALEMLEKNLAMRKEIGASSNIRACDVNPALLKAGSSFTILGLRDKKGRGVSYLRPAAVVPTDYSLNEYLTFLLWSMDYAQWETPDFHRHGFVVIEDLHHVGFKHFDNRLMSSKNKGKNTNLQDLFPARIQGIYVLHAPFIIKPLLKIAKIFVKAKLLQRVEIMSKPEDLFEYVAPENVASSFGGTLQYDHHAVIDGLIAASRAETPSTQH